MPTIAADLTKEILNELKQQKELATETKIGVEAVREQLTQMNVSIEKHKVLDGVSYAAMAVSAKIDKPPSLKPQSVHSMVMSSVDAHDTSDDVINKIRTAVSAKTTGIRVDRLRKARDQKVVELGCQSRDDLAKVVERLKAAGPTLLTQEMENKDPLVIIYGVLKINTDDDIVTSLKSQNAHILGVIAEDECRVSVRYRRRARNPHENHVVLQVSPLIWQRLTAAGKVHIDLQRVAVKDQSPLVTCSRCLGYGHGRKTCQESEDTCSHCAGPHLRNACPVWQAGDRPTCRNCQNSRLERSDHNSFDENCPIRKKWDALARAKVAYC